MTQQAKHTPGPWRLGRGFGSKWDDAICDGPFIVARVNGEGYVNGWHPRSEATARLIAAAPELLAALTMAAAGFATIANNLPATAEAARLVALDNFKACEAIIAKAEGR